MNSKGFFYIYQLERGLKHCRCFDQNAHFLVGIYTYVEELFTVHATAEKPRFTHK